MKRWYRLLLETVSNWSTESKKWQGHEGFKTNERQGNEPPGGKYVTGGDRSVYGGKVFRSGRHKTKRYFGTD